MKRSRTISLVLMGSVAMATTPMLSSCGDDAPPPDNGGTFTTMAECVAVYDQQTCQASQQMAQQEHLRNAPHFSSYDQCVAQYGPTGCASGSAYGGASNVFVPAMLGYMIGSASSRPAPLYYAPYAYQHASQVGYSAPLMSSAPGYRGPVATAPFTSTRAPLTKGSLSAGTALQTGTVAPSARGGFGGSIKPTVAFKQSYSAANPSSFGRAALPQTSTAFRAATVSRSSVSTSTSARGGFGSMGRGFSGGSFGG